MLPGWCCTKAVCMSMSDEHDDLEEPQAREMTAPTRLAGGLEPRVETPIVPKSTLAGRALVWVRAIMTFLAAITTGGVMMIRSAASEWQSDVAREVTIQIRPAAGRDVEADIAAAARIARATAGVADVRPYTKEESAALLQPWLGT